MERRDFLKASFYGSSLLTTLGSLEYLRAEDRARLDAPAKRARIRELGIKIGTLPPGRNNAITDVEGVRVGHTTIIKGQAKGAVRTGVTVILPHSGNIYEENLYAALFNQNGWGEMTGMVSLENSGLLKTPIFLTGTYNVGIVYHAAMQYLARLNPSAADSAEVPSPVVAECLDDDLSDVKSRPISKADVFKAIEDAKSGPVEEGNVGGGMGMTAFDFKGGIGTSSRKIDKGYVVGVLVMANTANRSELRIDGVPAGREIQGYEYKLGPTKSIILIAATDAPLLPYQLRKIGKHVAMGLAQTGAISHTTSGDIILAFSTGNRIPRKNSSPVRSVKAVNDFWMTPLYQAAVEATQEAILNSITMAETIVGRDGHTAYGIPLDQVSRIMKKYQRIRGRSDA
jgi:D-aminopeptidase